MKFLTVTELRQKATEIVSEIQSTGDRVVITKRGKPVVLMQPVSNDNFTLKIKGKGVKNHGRGRESRGKKTQGRGAQRTLQKG